MEKSGPRGRLDAGRPVFRKFLVWQAGCVYIKMFAVIRRRAKMVAICFQQSVVNLLGRFVEVVRGL